MACVGQESMRKCIETVREYVILLEMFLRNGHPYQKAFLSVGLLVIVVFVLGLVFSLPEADANSVQAGLTVIAETLGVLLGVVFVVIVLLIEQGRQAKDLLVAASQKYRDLLSQHINDIDAERKKLVSSVKRKEIQLDDPQPGYNPVPHRDIIYDLS